MQIAWNRPCSKLYFSYTSCGFSGNFKTLLRKESFKVVSFSGKNRQSLSPLRRPLSEMSQYQTVRLSYDKLVLIQNFHLTFYIWRGGESDSFTRRLQQWHFFKDLYRKKRLFKKSHSHYISPSLCTAHKQAVLTLFERVNSK